MLGWLKRRKGNTEQCLGEAFGKLELPSFPAVISSGMRMLRSPDVMLGDVSEELVKDPKVSARILSIASSPAYALRNPPRNVHHAVSMLGRSEVEAILLSVAVQNVMPAGPTSVDLRTFWQTAARRATLARSLAKDHHPASLSETFTAALLQDMAIPLLAQTKGEPYEKVLHAWRSGEGSLIDLERAAFPFDHALVAGSMCEKWGFPEKLTSAIGGHHDIADAAIPEAVRVVTVIHDSDDGASDALIARMEESFGMSADATTERTTDSFQVADELSQMLSTG